MTTQLSFVTLDVFTQTRYTGNPLAIVKVPQAITLSQTQKQRIAREFNLSETVFLHEQTDKDKSESLVGLTSSLHTLKSRSPGTLRLGPPTIYSAC